MRQVGSRRERILAMNASGMLLAEGARFMVLPDGAAKDIDPRWFEEGENIGVADA